MIGKGSFGGKKTSECWKNVLKKCEISLTCPSPTHQSLDWAQTMLACLSWVQGRATETSNYNFDDHWSLIRRISIFTWVMRPSLWMLRWWTSSARVGNLDSAVTKYWKKFHNFNKISEEWHCKRTDNYSRKLWYITDTRLTSRNSFYFHNYIRGSLSKDVTARQVVIYAAK